MRFGWFHFQLLLLKKRRTCQSCTKNSVHFTNALIVLWLVWLSVLAGWVNCIIHDGSSSRTTITSDTLLTDDLQRTINSWELSDEVSFIHDPSQFDDSGLVELFQLFELTKCHRLWDDHCAPGSVQVNSWLSSSLKTQYYLARNDPINQVQFVGTHNSFNARADGYGGDDNLLRKVLHFFFNNTDIVIAQQEYSMTDQLNFGVRVLHLDPIWFFDRLVMCHGGTSFPWFDRLVKLLEDALHKKFEYDSNQIGCTFSDRLWSDGMEEIATWIESNPSEIVFVFINDAPHWDWGHYKELLSPIEQFMKKVLFTPGDKNLLFPDRWPSMNELVSMNKRIILVGSNDYATWNGTYIHEPLWTGFPGKNANNFEGWPKCTRKGVEKPYNYSNDWNCVSGESVVYGPFYDGPDDMGLITPDNIQTLVDCGVKIISLDQASPALVQNTIWTWAEGNPLANLSCTFATIQPKDPRSNYKGTWYSERCDQKLPIACESVTMKGEWTFGAPMRLLTDQAVQCPQGFQFSVPTNAYYSKKLRSQMEARGIDKVWLNFHS